MLVGFPPVDRNGLGTKGAIPCIETWRELHVQLLPASGAQHDAVGPGVVAGREMACSGDVRIDLERRSENSDSDRIDI